MLNPLGGNPTGVEVTDLSGNILWTYANPGNNAYDWIQGVKTLPDGDFLMAIGDNSALPLTGPLPADSIIEIREVNLAGNTDSRYFDFHSELRNWRPQPARNARSRCTPSIMMSPHCRMAIGWSLATRRWRCPVLQPQH